jgi:hypothetical protein
MFFDGVSKCCYIKKGIEKETKYWLGLKRKWREKTINNKEEKSKKKENKKRNNKI